MTPLSVLHPEPFTDPKRTAKGEERAQVYLRRLDTLWFNTGTLCNLACENCYIASSPHNDRLVYLCVEDILPYLQEAKRDFNTGTIGFTGGEPFLNPHFEALLQITLEQGFEVLVLTNAMRPMMRPRVQQFLISLSSQHRQRLTFRVSLDHFTRARHDAERGVGAFDTATAGLRWLAARGFRLHIAGRASFTEDDHTARSGYQELMADLNLDLDCNDPEQLVLFPEMTDTPSVPEITSACWDVLHVNPEAMMCASSRMVVKRRGASHPTVLACTLLAYDDRFELGSTLAEANTAVPLNHPHCAQFCVLGGGACA